MTLLEPRWPTHRGRPRVLIVDDHVLSNRVMTLVLRSRGFPCVAATNEAHALVLVEEFAPDVVLLEWASRTDREVERAARIRRLAAAGGRSVAIIVVTHEPVCPPSEILGNVDGYFTKPVILERLEQAILSVTALSPRTQVG